MQLCGFIRSWVKRTGHYIQPVSYTHLDVDKRQAHKVFRGSIDFKRGASGAKGTESEQVLLLGDDVINQTIPLILCAEEDVEGNHGAAIGELDEELSLIHILTSKECILSGCV